MKGRWEFEISGAILTGILIGAIEATVGAFLHIIDFPFTGATMTSLLFTVLGIMMWVYKPKNPFIFGSLAAIFALGVKWLNYFIPGKFPGVCTAPFGLCLYPSMQAILFEMLSFSLFMQVFSNKYYLEDKYKLLTIILASFLAWTLFGVRKFKGWDYLIYKMWGKDFTLTSIISSVFTIISFRILGKKEVNIYKMYMKDKTSFFIKTAVSSVVLLIVSILPIFL